MSDATLPAKVLGYSASPFPVSFDGSGGLFGSALFGLIVCTSLAVMLGVSHFRRLWIDRKQGNILVEAFRWTIVCVCLGLIDRAVPEIVYMIAYADSSPSTLQTILTVKRICDTLMIIPAGGWMVTLFIYGPEIEFAIKYPSGKMWTDNRLHRLKRFGYITTLAGAFALTVTIGRLFG